MPIFRVKSVKIYTGQKNLHWRRRPRRRQLSGMIGYQTPLISDGSTNWKGSVSGGASHRSHGHLFHPQGILNKYRICYDRPPNQIKYWTILDYTKASWCMIASPAGQQLVRRQTIVLRFRHISTGCARIHLSWVESVHAEHGSLSFQGCLSHLMRSCPGCSIFFQPKPWEIVLATRGRVCLNFIKASYHYSSVSHVAFSAFMVPRMLLFRYNSYNSIYGAIFRFRFGFSKIMISIFSIVTSPVLLDCDVFWSPRLWCFPIFKIFIFDLADRNVLWSYRS